MLFILQRGDEIVEVPTTTNWFINLRNTFFLPSCMQQHPESSYEGDAV